MKVNVLSPFFSGETARPDDFIGGVERHVEEIAKSMAEQGHDITIITSGTKDSTEVQGKLRVQRFERKRILFRTPFFDWKKGIETEADIVHVHGTYPFLSDKSADICNKMRIPSVLTYHFDGYMPGLIGSSASWAYYRTLGTKMAEHTRIIATSQGYVDNSKFLSRIPKEKIEIIPNGFDLSVFNPQGDDSAALKELGLEPGYVLFIGRLVPYKGVKYLIQAMKDDERELVIVGTGPLEKELKEMGKGTFLGRVEDEYLAPLYRNAQATVLPSIYKSEAFGITLVESMACGTPVIGSDLPGVRDVAAMGGLVAKREDVRDLKKKLEEVKKLDIVPKQLHDQVADRYSWSTIAQQTLNLYKDLLNSG